MPNCRTCDKEIVWVKTASGKNMPVDADSVEKDDTGKYPADFDAETMVSHFETCPQADQHRRKA